MRWIAVLLLATLPALGQYVYYSTTFDWPTDMYNHPIIPSAWATSDEYAFSTSSGYLTNHDIYSSGYLKYTGNYSSPTGEVKTALRLQATGGTISHYLNMRDGAWVPNPSGAGSSYQVGPTWLRVDLRNIAVSGSSCSATLAVSQAIGGTLTALASKAVGCHDGLQMRSVVANGKLLVYFDNTLIFGPYTAPGNIFVSFYDSAPSGIGIANLPTVNGITQLSLGNLDFMGPNAVSSSSVVVSSQPTSIGLSWAGATDNGNYGMYPTGVARYVIRRDGTALAETTGTSFTDTTVTPTATYTYSISAVDYHNNWSAPTDKTVTVPTNSGPEWMRKGLRPTNSYWGGEGENINLFSGNLNFSLPLITAVGRNGWKLPLGLSYNSQNWKQDQSGTYNSGQDIGYGYGWIMTPGKIRPSYSDSVTIHHYTYTDPSGAEYRLDVNESGKWRTKEGPLVRFEASTQKLWFPDGSYWCFYGLSGGNEADAGTMYPTHLYDRNGNLTLIQYMQGSQAAAGSTSGRISTISDVRASQDLGAVFQFEYNTDATPHLIRITNLIAPSQKFEFTYSTGQTLTAPFSPFGAYGTTTLLTTVTHVGLGLSHAFTYGTNNSGELETVTLPRGGKFRWSYTDILYGNQQRFREVSNRWLTMSSGAAEYSYTIAAPGSVPMAGHLSRTIVDPGNSGANDHVWYFNNDSTSAYFGFTTKEEERVLTPTQRALVRWETTWTVNSNQNPYARAIVTKLDPDTANEKVSKVEFTRDAYLNATEERQYEYGNLTTPARRAWKVMDTTMASQGMYDRVQSTGVTAGAQTVTTAQFAYDGAASSNCGSSSVALADAPNITFHDSAFGTNRTDRGLPTWVSQLGKPAVCVSYDIAGNVTRSREQATSKEVSFTLTEATKYALPAMTTPNNNSNLATSYQWNQMLGMTQATGANGATSTFTYDAIQRPATTTNAHGGITTYYYSPTWSYAENASGRYGTAVDGFGRTTQTRVGDSLGWKSYTNTYYEPCACSPIGKMKGVSMPFAEGATAKYTVYTYDGRGRTVTVTLPDGAGQTTYLYEGNTVKVTSPVRDASRPIWKKYTMDAFGNLVQVNEPNPDGGADLVTTYTYNLFNQLLTVTMPRGATTQTRTFTYNSLFQLTSVVQPETGTTAYTYGLDGQVATKTDAKGVVTAYGRDGYGRLVGVYVKPVGWTGYDYTQSPTYGYDLGVNAQGRLSTVTLGSVMETYEYSVGGLVTKKKVTFPNNDTPLEANYTYDTEGRLASTKYPDVYGADGTVAETGRTLSYFYDSLGLASLRDSTYPIAPGYRVGAWRNAAAQITQMVVYKPDGTSDTETFTYNSLGQLTQASGRGSNIEYRYSATANDGRITSRKDNVSGEEVSYQYDQLGRLIAASTTGPEWGLGWVYDGFGNRLQQNVTKGTGPSAVFNVDPMTNRMTGAGINYDANGNMTGFGTGSGTATYDLFNRMVNVTTGNGTEWYGYSAANQRIQVSRANGTFETFFYGLGGELLGVYQRGTKANGHYYFSSASIRVWFAGRLIDGGGNSMVTDRLGSVVKNGTEALSYYPYGEQRTGNANADREKFATYSRDAVSGLDYAWNRYYSAAWGRFTSADPYGGSVRATDPQSWNRYSYTDSDPINRNDSSGLCWWCRFMAPDEFGIRAWLESYSEGGGGNFKLWVPLTDPSKLGEISESPDEEAVLFTSVSGKGGAKKALDEKLAEVYETNCWKKLFGEQALSAIQSKAGSITYYDGRSDKGMMDKLGGGPHMTFADYHAARPSAAATTLLNRNNTASANVVLWADFFGAVNTGNPTPYWEQQNLLWHEAVHALTGLTDDQLVSKFGISTKGYLTTSAAFNDWLTKKDCGGKP